MSIKPVAAGLKPPVWKNIQKDNMGAAVPNEPKNKKNCSCFGLCYFIFCTHYEHTFDSNKFLGHFTTDFVILFASDILLIKKIITSSVKCYSVVVVCLHVIMATFDLHMNLTHFVFWGRLACFSDNYIWISRRLLIFTICVKTIHSFLLRRFAPKWIDINYKDIYCNVLR